MTEWKVYSNGAAVWAPPKEDMLHRRFIVSLRDGTIHPRSPGEVDDLCDQLREWLLERYDGSTKHHTSVDRAPDK